MLCISHVVEENVSANLRLDRYVSENMRLLSRSQIKARGLTAKINGKNEKLSRTVKCGDILELVWEDNVSENILPENIPLDIIYEDERCVVINKAQGLVVHPGAGNKSGTMANALLFRRQNKDGGNLTAGLRTGIVHRLDKKTSGVIIAAYDDEAQAFLSNQFKERKTKKTYIAIICGTPKEKTGRIETLIARDPKDRKRFTVSSSIGRRAITFFKVIKSFKNHSVVMLRPKTGRTHQLRVHMRHLGHPILGDQVYGIKDKNFSDVTLMLHSRSLEIVLPGKTEPEKFSSPVPERFISVVNRLNKNSQGINE